MAVKATLGDLRNGIENMYRDIRREAGNGEAPNGLLLARVRRDIANQLRLLGKQLEDTALVKLLNEVSNRKGRGPAGASLLDLFEDYRGIPKQVAISRRIKKSTAELTIAQAELWLEAHTKRRDDAKHQTFRQMLTAIAPPAGTFAKGRDFAAWLGLVPKQAPTSGKQKLGAISRMGERTIRRLLIIGSSAVVLQASKRGAPAGSWREGMLARKPRMLVKVVLPTRWRARSGHCWSNKRITELRSQSRRNAEAGQRRRRAQSVEAVIPAKSNRRTPITHHRAKYRGRNLVKRLFSSSRTGAASPRDMTNQSILSRLRQPCLSIPVIALCPRGLIT
jgi:hypothetical protein